MQHLHAIRQSGAWFEGDVPPLHAEAAIADELQYVTRPMTLVEKDGQLAVAKEGSVVFGDTAMIEGKHYPVKGYVPGIHPAALGSRSFCQRLGIQFPYIAGAMANGIASVEMVEAMGNAGMIGFFGAAGLSVEQVEASIKDIKHRLGDKPFGVNLIHCPNEPGLEAAVADLYIKHHVRLVSASAYLDLTWPLVYYRLKGIHRNADGEVVCPNQIIAKVSRVEVAQKFFSPAPDKILKQLLDMGKITQLEAELAKEVPVAHDLTAEADSGGHTDNRSVVVLLPTMLALRDSFFEKYQYTRRLCVGLAGGIATPVSAAAAFAMGADFIVTGSINQSCQEAGTSDTVRELLAQARQADVAMAPAADMFEMGVKVQVLKWGTMFAVRGRKLYDLYRSYGGLQDLPATQRALLERDYFRCTLEEAWEQTRQFFEKVDPSQNERALKDPKHQMALVFRSYLGRASKWANAGVPDRKVDYQIWCGPAMGAFNAWVKDSFLESPKARHVDILAMNLLYGAAVVTRLNSLRMQGVELPASCQAVRPLSLASIYDRIAHS